MFVKDLPLDLTDDELNRIFSAHGEITSCVIQRKEDKVTSLGFGFINFKDFDAARQVGRPTTPFPHCSPRLSLARSRLWSR